jgi:acyl-CoA synthetase (NDP forming)/GNAT superfamily N-acetyltransferase
MTYTPIRPAPPAVVHALLSDGETVCIRPAQSGDDERVQRLYDGLSDESLRLRFFGASRASGRRAAGRLPGPPREGHLALVAVHGGQVIAVAEYERTVAPTVAEISLAVADGFHRRGVGTLLVEHLADAARRAGISVLTAVTLADNHLMQQVVTDLGLPVRRSLEGGEVHVGIAVEPDERYLAALDHRAGIADLASLRPLLRPGSVAVVGAGRSPGSVGRAVLRKIKDGRFTGRLYAVNPHAHAVLGVPSFPAVADLPHPPDLAVLAVPAAAVVEVAEQCGAAGVRALVVLAAGLDADQGAALLAACRRHDMRMVGPNCLGIAATASGIRLDATFAAHRPLPGGAGVAVQSGGVGMALMNGLTRLGIGVSDFVSMGDKYDVSGNDLLRFWEADPRTRMALVHLESFGNPRVFSRTARRVAHSMPVLTVDAGRSAAGRRAAAAHSAAAATPTMTRQALFAQAGITAARSVAELLDTAALFHSQPLPAGARVAVVSNAGGAAVLAADACAEAGLAVPELPPAVVRELLEVLPEGAGGVNPVDVTPTAGEAELAACVDLLAGSGAVDTVLVVLVPTALTAATGDDPQRALTHPDPARRTLTVAAVLLDQAEEVRLLQGSDGSAVPAYADPRAAAAALAHAVARARWLARPPGAVPVPGGTDREAANALAERYLGRHPDGGWLDPGDCSALLDRYGIPHTPTRLVPSPDRAAAAYRELTGGSGPAAVKVHRPGPPPRSEQGAVALDLPDEEAVRTAARDLTRRFGDVMSGMTVQPMEARGTEAVAAVTADEVFGPLVVFGLGDTTAELLDDQAARLAPLTDRDVHDLITAPRGAPLLRGHGGAEPVDPAGLEQLLHRLSAMGCDLPQLAEAHLDLVARHDGVVAVDVRVRLLPRRATDPYLRRLR